MKSRIPLRELNEPSGFMGLSIADLCVIGYSLVILNQVLEGWNLGFLAIPIAAIEAFVLSTVRLRYRSKITRDFAIHHFGSRRVYAATVRND